MASGSPVLGFVRFLPMFSLNVSKYKLLKKKAIYDKENLNKIFCETNKY